MADILIDIVVKGNQDVVKATKSTKSLQSNVKLLSDAFQKQTLSQRQYYKGIKQLAEATGRSEKELRNLATTMRKVEKQEREAKAAAKQYAQARREAEEANRRYDAEQKKSAITAAKAARENKRVADSYVRIKMAADPVYAAEVKLKQAQRDVITAYKQGNVTRREAVETMRQYRAALQNGTLAGQGLNKGMNRMGVLFQQTGYQVGDFAVQVQSGTHMMVALGQQATQLVGTFGMLAKSTKMIAAFAGLGIIVPILTAVAGGFMRASGGAKSLTESLSDLNSKVDEYISLSESVGDFGAEGFGRVKEELKGTSDAYRDL